METEKRLIAFDQITFESFTRHATKHREPDANPYDMGYVDAVEQIDDWMDANTVDAVSRGVHDQVRWERDVAIEQLESYGISLGEKAEVAKVVHGRWNLADDGDGVVCSVCGTDFCILLNETDNFNYCPNCGAKMDLKGE